VSNNFSLRYLNRRAFLKKGLWVIGVALLYGFARMVESQKTPPKTPKRIAKESLAEGINFFDEVILIKSKNTITAFEAKCTHLGCQLKHSENGIIRCSCHGSGFNQMGEAVQGPAFKPLKKIDISLSVDSQLLEIELP
jgi:Rieske Fe-S protein